MHVMKSMELDDEQKLDAVQPIPMPDKPDYPYGLRITLTEKELKKLDLDPEEACIDGIVHLHALARITSVSRDSVNKGEERCRVELQIEDLAIEGEDAENED